MVDWDLLKPYRQTYKTGQNQKWRMKRTQPYKCFLLFSQTIKQQQQEKLYDTLQDMMSQLEADDDLDSITSKSIQYWVMGFQENERTVFALFPGNYTLYKVEVQMNWLTQRFFSGIFI